MNSTCLWLSVLCLAAMSTARAQDVPDIAVFSFENTSCAAWKRSRDDEFLRAQYRAWFRGFVSGYNFGNAANQVQLSAMPDLAAVDVYVDKYCEDNPSLAFINAAVPMIQEKREFRSPGSERKP